MNSKKYCSPLCYAIKLAFIAVVCLLLFACGSKSEADFSIVPVKGSGGEYQYIDISKKGKIVINPQFRYASNFEDGLALVRTAGEDGKYGYIMPTERNHIVQ